MKKFLLPGALVALLVIAGIAAAQNPPPALFIASPTGAEQINVVNTGPQITSILLSQARDAAGYSKLVPTTGQTLTVANNKSVVQLTPAGVLAALTFVTPAKPVDGQRLLFFTTQGITTFNLNANTGQTVNGNLAGTLSANGHVEYLYSASNTTWDRIQ